MLRVTLPKLAGKPTQHRDRNALFQLALGLDTEQTMAFDENIRPDVQAVLNTSALLEITEFEVFSIAYRDWFGRRPADEVIEPFYTDYMFNEVVPTWVRHFTRLVLRLAQEGHLDPRQFGIEPKPFSTSMAARGLRYLLASIVWLTTLVLLARFVAGYWPVADCYFPPCY